MKRYAVLFIFGTLFTFQCQVKVKNTSMDLSKQQVLETEKQFELLTAQKGLAESFYQFADSNAVLNRGETIIQGKDKIREHYQNSTLKNVLLKWDADFVEVAHSGDLAYTYGKYTFTAIDTSGKLIDNKGIFHTVWKKQNDGSWKFVWD